MGSSQGAIGKGGEVKVPAVIVSAFLGACILLEAWTLNTLDNLKADVAAIKAQLQLQTQIAKNEH